MAQDQDAKTGDLSNVSAATSPEATHPPAADPVTDLSADAAQGASDEPDQSPSAQMQSPAQATPAAKSGATFLALALGGAVAATLGFGAAQFFPKGWPLATGAPPAELTTALAANATLATDLGTARQDIDTLQNRLRAVTDQLAAQTESLAQASKRLSAAETAASQMPDLAALTTLQAEFDMLRQTVADQNAQTNPGIDIAALIASTQTSLQETENRMRMLQDSAEQSARSAAIRTALMELRTALDAGGAFDLPLATLSALSVDVPPALADTAQGVPSTADLQNMFSAPARAALAAARRANVAQDQSVWDRATDFVQMQLGLRSLSARAGDDPDAVLSRATASVGRGDLSATLTELAALSEAGRAPLSDWITSAQRRLAAETALVALTATVAR